MSVNNHEAALKQSV